jgi:hypothetical protein
MRLGVMFKLLVIVGGHMLLLMLFVGMGMQLLMWKHSGKVWNPRHGKLKLK